MFVCCDFSVFVVCVVCAFCCEFVFVVVGVCGVVVGLCLVWFVRGVVGLFWCFVYLRLSLVWLCLLLLVCGRCCCGMCVCCFRMCACF